MEKKFKETSIPEDFSKELAKQSLILGPSNVGRVITALFHGTSSRLAQVKNVSVPKALVFKALDGSFLAAAKVEFIPNGDDMSNGRWDYTWTFYSEDLDANTEVMDANNQRELTAAMAESAQALYGMRFVNSDAMILMMIKSLEMIKNWLRENTTDTEPATLVMDGVFVANGALEDNKLEVGLIPSGEMKVLIKDDSSIQQD